MRLTRPPPLETPLPLVRGRRRRLAARIRGGHDREGRDDAGSRSMCPSRRATWMPSGPRSTTRDFAITRFPDCFVCGPQRRRGDGLRIFPGLLDTGLVAAPWLPADALDAGDGKVAVRYHWAALDCPGFFAVSDGRRAMLLGEMQAHLDRRVRTGDPCTVIGWRIGGEGPQALRRDSDLRRRRRALRPRERDLDRRSIARPADRAGRQPAASRKADDEPAGAGQHQTRQQ